MNIDSKVTSADLLAWAEKRVNLSSEDAASYRKQGDNLKDRLEKYIAENPSFNLVKMVNSGSVAKGTALRTVSDMDIGVYVKRAAAPTTTGDLVGWLRDRLREAYGNLIPSERITTDDAAVRISFSGSGVDVECVAILYDNDPDDYGELVLRSGKRVRTSIRKHLEFVRARKKKHPKHFSQLVRFVKFWRNHCEQEQGFPLGTFATELIVAHAIDRGVDPANYPEALQQVFSYIVNSGLRDPIIFEDNYSANEVNLGQDAVRIFDPVASENNVAQACTLGARSTTVEAAADALDDICIARTATTKDAAIAAYRGIFGPEFSI